MAKLLGTGVFNDYYYATSEKAEGVVLCRSCIDEVFGEIPKEYYMASIKSDIEDGKTSIKDNPLYIIFNLTRALAYIRY